MEKKQVFSLWYFVVALMTILLLQEYLSRVPVEAIAYSDFKQLLRERKLPDGIEFDTGKFADHLKQAKA